MGIEEYGVKPPEKGKEKEVTVKDILADKKQSALFGEFVKNQPDGQERAERLLKGESSPDDIKELTEQKEKFFERQKEVEKISQVLKPEFISQLADSSAELKTLVQAVGVEGVRGAVTSQLEMLAMRDPVRFDAMVTSYDEVIKKAEVANQRIEKICEAHNITSKDYLKILAENPDEKERQEKLGDMIREKMGAVKGLRKKTIERNQAIRDKEVGKQAEEIDYKWEIDKLRADYDRELEDVGSLLAASINLKDSAMNKAFMSALLSEKASKEERVTGFTEMRGAMPSEKDLEIDWSTKWKEAEAKGTARSDFEKSYVDGKLGNKKGTWSDIAKAFMNKAITKW